MRKYGKAIKQFDWLVLVIGLNWTNNPKKIWSAFNVTYLEENKTTRIQDDASIAEVLNKHYTGLADSLVGKTAAQFNPTTLKSFVSERKTSNVKHAFCTITPNQIKRLIEAIPSATGVDDVSARTLKIAAHHSPNS